MAIVETTQQGIDGLSLLNLHKAFPGLTLHEVQDRYTELIDSHVYANFLLTDTKTRSNGVVGNSSQ